ncbi:hypothetical protein VQ643_07295, partial [Pseudomonas sp. F1_0610]|uniref:hypothetical protein n=1 Tax=Pseudomonas sp. F1_0610 TaxID=3114284 RepID=UPI0039C2D02F
ESVGVIVSFFLRNLKRFEKFENQWKYYLSIKDLKPRDIAERTFVDLLEEKVRDIPLAYRKDIVSFLENSSKNKWYLNLIQEINSLAKYRLNQMCLICCYSNQALLFIT